MGAVVGYGDPLQGSCLEGFDFLGLHHIIFVDDILILLYNVRNCGAKMKDLQIEIEKIFTDKNQVFPATWSFEKNEKGFYYFEATTNKKRYGIVRKCLYCSRDFLARNNWLEKAHTCSVFCRALLQQNRVTLKCSWCEKEITKQVKNLKNSRSGLFFCDRKCKEEAQKVGGIEEIQPEHYKDGTKAYSLRALNHYGCKCVDCNVVLESMLHVHHIDGNRKNGSVENLEVVCLTHHALRHMKKNKLGLWVVDFKCLTPRDKLEELRKLLIGN